MAEVIAIRTFIKLKVLEAIPETGSISLEDLARATGAQDSLLGSPLFDHVKCCESPLTLCYRTNGSNPG